MKIILIALLLTISMSLHAQVVSVPRYDPDLVKLVSDSCVVYGLYFTPPIAGELGTLNFKALVRRFIAQQRCDYDKYVRKFKFKGPCRYVQVCTDICGVRRHYTFEEFGDYIYDNCN